MEDEEARSEKTTVFEVEAKESRYVQAQSTYHIDCRAKCLPNLSLAECAIHFWQKCLAADDG